MTAPGDRPPGFPSFGDDILRYNENRKKALGARVEEIEKEIQTAQKAAQNKRVAELEETIMNLKAAIKAYQDGTLGWGRSANFQGGKRVKVLTPGKQSLTEVGLASFSSKGTNIDNGSQGMECSL